MDVIIIEYLQSMLSIYSSFSEEIHFHSYLSLNPSSSNSFFRFQINVVIIGLSITTSKHNLEILNALSDIGYFISNFLLFLTLSYAGRIMQN